MQNTRKKEPRPKERDYLEAVLPAKAGIHAGQSRLCAREALNLPQRRDNIISKNDLKKDRVMTKIGSFGLAFVFCAFAQACYADLFGGGGQNFDVPKSATAGNPTTITYIPCVWGIGGPIKDRFTGLSLHYRLKGQERYGSVAPQPIAVPDNYANWAKASPSYKRECEAFTFTIPAYAKGTKGELEYFVDSTFDGYHQNATTQTLKITE